MTFQAEGTDDGGDGVEQFSARSAARLREATEELVQVLRGYTEMITAMHGGSAEMLERFAASDAAQAAAWAWNERAFDHSGSFVLALAGDRPPAEGEDFDDEDRQDEDAELQVVEALSVVSRWDLGVVDADALLAAGRAAHQRNRPEEDEQDAAAAVANPAHALYALVHERGEPWYELPGVEVGYGARVYLQLDTDAPGDAAAEEAGGEEGEDFDPVQAVLPPPGRVLFSEDYA